MRERIESKHVTKEIKSQMPVIPVEIVKERGCTFCPYYLGNYEKQPRCMMKTCAWDDENERFHPVLRELIPFYKEKMEKAEEKFLAMKKIYTTLLGMFADEMKQEELEKDECYGFFLWFLNTLFHLIIDFLCLALQQVPQINFIGQDTLYR